MCVEFEGVEEGRQRPAMLALGGEKLRELCKTLGVSQADTYAEAKAKLMQHYTPKKNISAERFKFLNMRPETAEETHDHWVNRMRRKVKDCEFDKFNDEEAMKLVIMLYTPNPTLQRQIISKDMDFKKTLEQARALELTDRELARIRESGPQLGANKVALPGRYRRGQKGGQKGNNNAANSGTAYIYCGGKFSHTKDDPCRARDATCHRCGKQGHYGKVCRATPADRKRADAVSVTEDEGDIDSIIDAFLIHVNKAGSEDTPSGYPSTSITGHIEGVSLKLCVDSMADANIIGANHYASLAERVQLEPTAATIKPYGSPPIPTKGKFTAKLGTSKGDIETVFYVTQGKQPLALLGKYTAFDLGILKIEAAKASKQRPESTNMSYDDIAKLMTPPQQTKEFLKGVYRREDTHPKRVLGILKNHHKLFSGIGKHKYQQVKLPVDPLVTLKIQPQRKIPFPKRSKLKTLLQELHREDVIEHVDGPTDCISNLVLTAKANPEEIRMNIDMTCANEAIKRTRHVIPALDEMRAQLNGATIFSKLDMRHGYMQLELAEESRHLTTFYTPEGLRRSKRLIFGANAAAELFHEEIRRSLADIAGVINIYDDMLVFGKTQPEHDYALARLLQRLEDLGLTLNESKCKFGQNEATFFGMRFSPQGMSPTQSRVQALMEAAPPSSVTEIRSFLGMANFSAPFIPDFAIMTAPLRLLTQKNAKFQWTMAEITAFERIKHALTADTVMAYFDIDRETRVIVDGSKKDGVSSILTQRDPPTGHFRVIRYDSRATTKPEKNYAPIEVESLAILFGLEKNHLYLHGLKHFTVCTDHKPLVTLYSQYRKEISARVQKHKLALQGKYNFTVVWEAGKDNQQTSWKVPR